MDYIREMNAFYDLDMAIQITPNAISLYFALLNMANKLYWRANFTASNITLQSKAGISNRKTLERARKQLIQMELISYNQSGNQAGAYTILGCVGQITGKNVPTNGAQDAEGGQMMGKNVPSNGQKTEKEGQMMGKNVPESVHINKLNKSNLNKTKNKDMYAQNDDLKNKPEKKPKPKPKSKAEPKLLKEKSEELFNRFWAAYPKKRSKGKARDTWDKLDLDEQLVATMLATIEQAKKSREWQKENGQFIPYPATWLNREGWSDEYTVKNQGVGDKYAGIGWDTKPEDFL